MIVSIDSPPIFRLNTTDLPNIYSDRQKVSRQIDQVDVDRPDQSAGQEQVTIQPSAPKFPRRHLNN